MFKFRGKIIHFGVNFPGIWHDRKVLLGLGLLIDRLLHEKTPRGKSILGDSALFTKNRVTHGKIIRGRKTTETSDIPFLPLLDAVDAILQRAMPRDRQSAE